MKHIKHKYFKSVSFFELSINCVCRGVSDNDGQPFLYPSPFNLNEIFEKICLLNDFYKEPLRVLRDDSFHEDFLISNKIPYVLVENNDELALSNKDFGDGLSEDDFDGIKTTLNDDDKIYDEESDEVDGLENYESPEALNVVPDDESSVGIIENDNAFPSRSYNRDSIDVYLKDIKEADDFFVLLINYTDISSPHNVTRDIKSGVRDETELSSHQGQDKSAHVVVFKDIKDNKCQCVIERNSGLSMALISSFLDFLAASVSRSKSYRSLFKIDDPKQEVDAKGKIKKRTIRPKFSLQGFLSNGFIEDLENGVVGNMFLVGDPKKYAGTDIDVPDQFEEIKIKIKPDYSVGDTWKALLPECLTVGKKYKLDSLRISFKDPTGKTRTEEIDVDSDINSGDMEYVKKRRIGMAIRPKSSYNQVKVSILRKILEAVDE